MSKVGIYINEGSLIVPIQTDLRNDALEQLQKDILKTVRETRLRGVIIDLSGVSLLDTYQAKKIFAIGKMTGLMGTVTVFTGLSAGIVVSLTDLDFDSSEVLTSINLEEGSKLLKSMKGTTARTDEGS
ncbi:STAS domain-containing protein [Desulfobacterales bacterium HSG16]|nr:STAS domain-containing protein [Desulfobacterales bacterium HSG16]